MIKKILFITAFVLILANWIVNLRQPIVNSTGNTPSVSRCENVSMDIVSNIESGLKIQGGGHLKSAKAVKSKDFESVYFISAELEGEGMNNSIATFATNRLGEGGSIFSVNYVAKEFSDWGFGPDTTADITMSDDGAEESVNCVKNNL